MIFFPFIYKDELLYSICARYHRNSGNENYKTTMYELFGTNNVCATTLFTTHLNNLSQKLPVADTYISKDFITNHTFLPYYAPFIPEKRYHELHQIMSNGNGTGLYMKLGKVASTIKSPKKLRICYECLKEDISTKGEVILRRTHQAEGVKLCSKHHILLIDSEIPYSEKKNKHELLNVEKCISYEESIRTEINDCLEIEHLKFIANQTYYLLNNRIKPLGQKNITAFYIGKLKKKGFVTASERIRWRDLIPVFNQFYGEELLNELNCFINIYKEDTWLHKLLRKPRVSCHPLRHILLLGFLGETVSSMESQLKDISYKPFGSGPWLCLNKAAEHYKKNVITSCAITRDYKTSLPVGTFSCSCGFIFSRKGPDKSPEDLFKIGRIKEFGDVWENKLKQLVNSKLSLRNKAEILGVDPKTVKNRLDFNDRLRIKLTTNVISKKNEYRKQWAGLIKDNSEKSITEIRSFNPKVYMWLYRNDKEWLKNNYPKTKKPSSCEGSKRVDWNQRDYEIAEKIQYIVQEIQEETSTIIRITKNEIGRRLGKLSFLNNNLDKMPEVEKILQEKIESVEQFQVRRVKNIIKEFKRSKANIKEWEVIRAAGLNRKYAELHNVLIQEEIQKNPY